MSAAANGAVSHAQHHVDRHRQPNRAVRPAELVMQRIHHHARNGPEPGRAQDRHEAHRGDHPRPVDAEARRVRVGGECHPTTFAEGSRRYQWHKRQQPSKTCHTGVVHRVVVLLLEPVVGFDATIAPLLFSNATDSDGNSLYDVVTCGLTTDPVASTTGFAMVPAAGAEALESADTVVIPGTRYAPARTDGVLGADVSKALARIRPGTRLVSICTGAFVLAAAGLLDGRPATTHWRFAADMRRLHPGVHLDEEILFVDDGDVLTSAGLAAGIDLCLHIIRSDHGAQVANAVARYCVVPPWREGRTGPVHRPRVHGHRSRLDRGHPRLGTGAPRRGTHRDAAGRARPHEPPARSTVASVRRPDRLLAPGSAAAGWTWPANCWNPGTCRSTRWPGVRVWAPRATCVTICGAGSRMSPSSYRKVYQGA